MANFGRFFGVPNPDFFPSSSFVSTAESLISLPAAEMVRITPTGKTFSTAIFFVQISQRLVPGFAPPCAMAFAVSMLLPPPTAKIKSAFLYQCSNLIFCFSSKYHFCRCIICKFLHRFLSSFCLQIFFLS